MERLKPYQTETKVITSLEVRTCLDTRAMGGQTDWQQDASSTQFAKNKSHFSAAFCATHTEENNTEINTCVEMCWVGKWLKTCIHLRGNLTLI